MTKERELLRRALEGLENRKEEVARWGSYVHEYLQNKWGYEASVPAYDSLIEEIRAYLAAEEGKEENEPVYLFRRKGLDDFVTCSKERFDELSENALFETKIIYPSCTQNSETATRSEDVVTEATDQKPVAWMSEERNFLYWEKFYDDMVPLFLHPFPQAEQRKREPLTTEEMENEYWDHIKWTSWTTFIAAVRFAEKHHGIGGRDA